MAQKRHLWSTDLVLDTLARWVELIIGYVMADNTYMSNLSSLSDPHGAEEAPVVH